MSSELRAVRHGDLLVLTLQHPSGFPRLERNVLRALSFEIDRLATNRELIAAVITGSPQAFCAGAEVAEITSLLASETFEFAREGQRVMDQIERSSKPVIAAVRGYCMGGGFDLALACRARIAASDAVFAHRGATLGLITGWGGTQRLPRLIGKARAIEIFATGRSIDADEALAIGLVGAIAAPDDVVPQAMELARAYGAANPTCA